MKTHTPSQDQQMPSTRGAQSPDGAFEVGGAIDSSFAERARMRRITPPEVMLLQRTIGNRAVLRLLQRASDKDAAPTAQVEEKNRSGANLPLSITATPRSSPSIQTKIADKNGKILLTQDDDIQTLEDFLKQKLRIKQIDRQSPLFLKFKTLVSSDEVIPENELPTRLYPYWQQPQEKKADSSAYFWSKNLKENEKFIPERSVKSIPTWFNNLNEALAQVQDIFSALKKAIDQESDTSWLISIASQHVSQLEKAILNARKAARRPSSLDTQLAKIQPLLVAVQYELVQAATDASSNDEKSLPKVDEEQSASDAIYKEETPEEWLMAQGGDDDSLLQLTTKQWPAALNEIYLALELGAQPPKRLQDASTRGGLIRPETESGKLKISQWLQEPVAFKQETGTDKHRKLLATVIQDLEELHKRAVGRKLADAERIEEQLVTTMTAFFLYLAHNATQLPVQGFGQAQEREAAHPLYYFRSQSKLVHVHEKFYQNSVDKVKKGFAKDANYILPTNQVVYGLLQETLGDETKLRKQTEHEQERMPRSKDAPPLYKKGKEFEGSYAGYAGLRKSNPAVYGEAIEILLNNKSLPQKLKELVSFIKAQYFSFASAEEYQAPDADDDEVSLALQQLQEEINLDSARSKEELEKEPLEKSPAEEGSTTRKESLFAKNMQYRSSFAANLADLLKGANFICFHVFNTTGNPNLVVQIHPPLQAKMLGFTLSKDYQDGWVNTVLTFFGGLLNQHAAQANLPIFVNRRQSFGFLRPTLTDTGASFRLSLGVQPTSFGRVIIQALHVLDTALYQFNPEMAGLAFEIVARGAGIDRDRLNIFMTSEVDQLRAYHAAQNFAAQGGGAFTSFVGWMVKDVMNRGFVNEVSGGKDPYLVASKRDRDLYKLEQLLRSNASAKNLRDQEEKFAKQQAEKLVAEFTQRDTPAKEISKEILQGVLHLAEQMILSLPPNALASYAKSYQWTLTRLINNVYKARSLLSEWNKQAQGLSSDEEMVKATTAESEDAHFYTKAVNVVESLLEHLIVLRALLRNEPTEESKEESKEEEKKEGEAKDKKVPQVESNIQAMLMKRYKLAQNQISVYRTEGGEQAGAAAVLATVKEAKGIDSNQPLSVGHAEPYFEFNSFLKHAGLLPEQAKQGALEIAHLVDISPGTAESEEKGVLFQNNLAVESLKKIAESLKGEKERPYTLIVDITNSDINDPRAIAVIEDWREQQKDLPGLRLVLFASLLKHEQLGLDKYQAGRIFVFGNPLAPDDLAALHESASHPLIDAYLEMMYELQGDGDFTPAKHTNRGKNTKREGRLTGGKSPKQSKGMEPKEQGKSHTGKPQKGGSAPSADNLESLLARYILVKPDDISMAVAADVYQAAANGGSWGNMQLIDALLKEYKVQINETNYVDLGAPLNKIVATSFNHFNVVIKGEWVYVKGDGDCAFRAVAKLMIAQDLTADGEETVVKQLRHKSQELMIAEPSLWRSMIEDTLAGASRAHEKGNLDLGMGFGNQLAGLLLSHYDKKYTQ